MRVVESRWEGERRFFSAKVQNEWVMLWVDLERNRRLKTNACEREGGKAYGKGIQTTADNFKWLFRAKVQNEWVRCGVISNECEKWELIFASRVS